MLGSSLRKLVGAAVLATVVVAMSANQADAGWRHWRWSGYYSPYVTAYYPAYYGYSWHRPWYGVSSYYYPSYSVGCCSSCYCSPCSCYSSCYSPCYSSCYSSVVGCCGGGVITGGTVIKGESLQKGTEAGKPMLAPTPASESTLPDPDPLGPPAAAPAGGAADALFPAADRSGGRTILTVDVPEDARVYVNGMLTKTPGTHRSYISRGLVSGFRYTYEIRAELSRDGKTQSDTKVVHVRAGETNDLAFNFDDSESHVAAAPAVTTLTLHVPADARVSLGGNETASRGEIRQFTTAELTHGEKWDNYQIVVTIERDGEVVTREKSLAIAGGDSRELNFDFSENSLALR